MTTQQLTPTQHAVLAYAIEHHGGKIDWFPEHVKGAARKKVIEGLAGRTLIEALDTEWLVADAGYAALGLERPEPASLVDDPEVESIVTAAEAEWNQQDTPADASTRRRRENTKQALVIQMLKRPEGATVAQIMEATGWLNHTVRGTLSGALRKRLGLNVVSAKNPDGVSTYRIA